MSLFTEPIDRFYLAKMCFGLLFVGSFLKLLSTALRGLLPNRGFDGESMLAFGLMSLLWAAAFHLIELRRRTFLARRRPA